MATMETTLTMKKKLSRKLSLEWFSANAIRRSFKSLTTKLKMTLTNPQLTEWHNAEAICGLREYSGTIRVVC